MTIFAPPPMTPMPEAREWFLVRNKVMEPRNGREGYTLGEIRYGVLDSPRICYTVEDEDRRLEEGNGKIYGKSAIPTGRFQLTRYQSPKRGSECILLNAVPGFSGVEIHAANHAEELLGCIAVGIEPLPDGVRNCKPALQSLIGELVRLTMAGISVFLNVTRSE
jgi:hypothetical protein